MCEVRSRLHLPVLLEPTRPIQSRDTHRDRGAISFANDGTLDRGSHLHRLSIEATVIRKRGLLAAYRGACKCEISRLS
jgi:hypothetical protein